jgi:RND family efflux transporter MFP subunit
MRTPLLALLCLGACHKADEAAAAGVEARTPVQIAAVAESPVRESSEYVATLKSRRSITLQPQIDGQITQILVHSGEHATQGQPLMQIDPAKQQAQVSSQQATHTSRIATLNYWKQQAERLQVLYDGGAVSKQELDQTKSQYAQAEADAHALDAAVREQQVQLQYFRISAPAAGVIGDIPVRVGDHVTPQTKLTTIDQNTMLEAYISVPVERSSDLREGLPVEITDSEGKALAQTQLNFVSSAVSDDTQSVLVKGVVSNEDGALRAGQFVRARIVWTTHSAPVVPMLAVFRLNGQHFAYVATGTGETLTAHQRPIAVGEQHGNDYAIKAGLKAGEQVVVSGVQKIHDGALLQALPAPTTTDAKASNSERPPSP